MTYLKFLRQDWPLIGFGFFMTFMTGPGQTYFIGIFRDSISASFDISIGLFSTIYSAVSILSAVVFFWSGKLIDEWPLRKVTLVFLIGFAAGAFVLAGSFHLVVMIIGLFSVRHIGQGLMGHVSSTSMARYFAANRAKAIALAALGYALSEALLPIATVVLMGLVGWRFAWVAVGAVVAVLALPLSMWFLGKTHRDLGLERPVVEEGAQGSAEVEVPKQEDMTRAQVIRDWRFWCILPSVVSSPYLLTGVFFHQASLAQEIGVSLELIAICFTGFAVANMLGTVLIGPIVDKHGYLLSYPISYFGFVAAMFWLAMADGFWGAMVFYAVTGFALGLAMPALGTLWPGLYGVRHLGAIRSMVMAAMVLSTGLAPASFGFLIEAGVGVTRIALYGGIFTLLCLSLFASFSFSEHQKKRASAS